MDEPETRHGWRNFGVAVATVVAVLFFIAAIAGPAPTHRTLCFVAVIFGIWSAMIWMLCDPSLFESDE